jgi:hypothetical protein
MDKKKIDIFDPAIIMAFLLAISSDFCFVFLIGAIIPGVGIAIIAFIVGLHYFLGVVLLPLFWSKAHGFLAKLSLILAILLPLPLLTIGIILSIALSNKFVAFVAVQLLAAATGGLGEVAEVGAAGEIATEGAEAGVELGEAAEGPSAMGETAEEMSPPGANAAPEESSLDKGEARKVQGENQEAEEPEEDIMGTAAEREPIEKLEGDLFEQTPEPEEEPENEELAGKKRFTKGSTQTFREKLEEKLKEKSQEKLQDIISPQKDEDDNDKENQDNQVVIDSEDEEGNEDASYQKKAA